MNEALELYYDQELVRVCNLEFDEITVGREQFNTICVPHPKISRRHGVISKTGDKTYYKDCSRYGSIVCGNVLFDGTVELKHGMTIEFGRYRLLYNAFSNKRDTQKTDLLSSTNDLDDWVVTLSNSDSSNIVRSFTDEIMTVGSHPSNHFVMASPDMPEHAITFIKMSDGVHVNIDNSDTSINGKRARVGLYRVNNCDRITLKKHIFHVERKKVFLVGSSLAMKKVGRDIEMAAKRLGNASVLIIGESGTGKELVANAIHSLSDRSEKEFIAINCSTIPPPLAESLLFGHRAGSFTNAVKGHVGYFEKSSGGTLFLDEIGDLPAALQVKILRAVEYREITPVGAEVPQKVDLRIITGTNKEITSGHYREINNFRDDLYYRLAAFVIEMPPLRSRKEDIPELIRHFHQELISHDPEHSNVKIGEYALQQAQEYNWPGNVRELRNQIRKAIMTADGNMVDVMVLDTNSDTAQSEANKLKTFAFMLRNGTSREQIMMRLNISRSTFYNWKDRVAAKFQNSPT